MKKTILFLLIFLVYISADTLTITLGIQPETQSFLSSQHYIDSLNSKLSQITLKLIYQPYERSYLSLISGKTDGDLLRSSLVYEKEMSVIAIEAPIIAKPIDYYLFALPTYLDTVTIMPSPSARFAATLHNRTVKAWLQKHELSFFTMQNIRQIVQMLQIKRIECFVGAKGYSDEPLFIDAGIARSSQPLFQDSLKLYIHQKHKDHIKEIKEAIHSLAKDSIYLSTF